MANPFLVVSSSQTLSIEQVDCFRFRFESEDALCDFVRDVRFDGGEWIAEDLENGRTVFCGNIGRYLARLVEVSLDVTWEPA